MRYKIRLILLILLLNFIFGSCGKSSDINKEKSISVNYSVFDTVDCYKSFLGGVDFIALHVLERLVDIDRNGFIYPMLLDKLPTVSEDGLTYSFELKENSRFSDKTAVKSEDVKYSFERMLWAKDSVSVSIANVIEGSDDIINGQTRNLSGFKIIDDKKFKIKLKQRFSPFLNTLTCTTASIYPKKKCIKMQDKWGKIIFGSGPYKIEKCNFKKEIILSKNQNYYGKKPEIDEIKINIMSDTAESIANYNLGKLDLINIPQDKYSWCLENKDFKNQIIVKNQSKTRFLMFNTQNKILKDVRVRKAISISIDREKICNFVLQRLSNPGNVYLPENIMGHDETSKIEYDIKEAKRLLKEAGYPNGFSIDYYRKHDDDYLIENALKGMMAKIGIKLNIISAQGDDFQEIVSLNRYTMHLAKWTAGPDPDDFFYYLFHSSASLPHGYKSNSFDSICEQARSVDDFDKRSKLYKELDYILCKKDYVIAPISHDYNIFLCKKNLKNIFFHQSIGVAVFTEAYLE